MTTPQADTEMSWLPHDDTPLLDAALAYAAHGLRVLKVHTIRRKPDGSAVCGCGKRDCTAQGKHPITRAWQRSATADVDAVRDARRAHPDANIGIALGGPERLVAIDIDGPNGRASWAELEREVAPAPDTLTAKSGRADGGEHRIYRVPAHLDMKRLGNRAAVNGLAGIDTRAENGQIVAPPSLHRSGAVYAWSRRVPIAELPEWLFEAIAAPLPERTPQAPQPPPAAHQASVHSLTERYVRTVIDNAARDISQAQEGGRNSLLFAKACTVFEYHVGAGLDHQEAWAALATAARTAGLPKGEIGSVLSKAWRQAQSSPRFVPPPSTPSAPATSPHHLPPPGAWEAEIDRNDRGIRKTQANVTTILGRHPAWAGVIAYDAFGECVVSTRPPPTRVQDTPTSPTAGDWTDQDTARTVNWLSTEYSLDVGAAFVEQAVAVVAARNVIHPVRDYLAGLEWDGTPRLDVLLCNYFGAADTPYSRGVASRWAISAVARVMQPGCQADCTLVLESRQHGTGKSTGLEILCGRSWFADTGLEIGNKDSYQCLRRKWIYELGELSGLKGRELHRTKNFLSARVDNYRPSYARRSRDFPRQNVFAGTTNEEQYLEDRTGNRRFLPVRISVVDRDAIARDRDQIWAEAVARYRRGEPWYADTAEFRALAEAEQADRVQSDPWEDIVAAWLPHPTVARPDSADGRYELDVLDLTFGITTTDALLGALRKRSGEITRSDEMRIGEVLRAVGLVPRRVREDGRRFRRYVRVAQPHSRLGQEVGPGQVPENTCEYTLGQPGQPINTNESLENKIHDAGAPRHNVQGCFEVGPVGPGGVQQVETATNPDGYEPLGVGQPTPAQPALGQPREPDFADWLQSHGIPSTAEQPGVDDAPQVGPPPPDTGKVKL